MELFEQSSYIEDIKSSLMVKLIDKNYRNLGSHSGRDYRRAHVRAQKKLAKKLAFYPTISNKRFR